MSILNISTIPYTPYDKLLFYPNVPSMIAGHATSIVGNILWEPTIDSSQTWPLGYLGLPNNNTGKLFQYIYVFIHFFFTRLLIILVTTKLFFQGEIDG